jgi:hypothetical protein
MKSQNELLKAVLNQGTHITALDALNWIGSMRLAARVYDLKQEGYEISKYVVTQPDGKRITYYYKERQHEPV